jgi:dihydroxy-acid dehydratase
MVMQLGLRPRGLEGKKPVIYPQPGTSAFVSHFKQRVEDVKRGVLQAGGFPLELPALSLSESLVKTTMLYRNMLAMDVEELPRSHRSTAALMGGCDGRPPGARNSAPTPLHHARRPHAARQRQARFWSVRTPGNGTNAAPARSTRRSGSERRHCAPHDHGNRQHHDRHCRGDGPHLRRVVDSRR